MPIYTLQVGTVSAAPRNVGEGIAAVLSHIATWGYSVTVIAIGSNTNLGKVQFTVTQTLTAAQLAHLGLA